MIIKNEEDVLERALQSVQDVVDEIIIVDTGSSDSSKTIAQKYTEHVYDFLWCDDFAKARNFSFSKATQDYCMWLDADDVLLEKDKQEFLNLKKTLTLETDVVMMKYNTAFHEDGHPTMTFYRERLLKREDHFLWSGFVHEVITPCGQILYSDIAITHQKSKPSDPSRNLQIFKTKKKEGVCFSPRETFYYARELYNHKLYDQAINEFSNFLNTKAGWIENNISSCQYLGHCFHEKGNKQEAINSLFNSFYYDLPRAEICCDLGQYFYELQSYRQAILWYGMALSCKRNDQSGAFVIPDCYDYIPYIQMCLCYDALKDYQTAKFYNEMAGKCRPYDPIYLYNKHYFEQILK